MICSPLPKQKFEIELIRKAGIELKLTQLIVQFVYLKYQFTNILLVSVSIHITFVGQRGQVTDCKSLI